MNTNVHNPVFDDKKEFLERQSEEYKSALLGTVHDIKEQSQDLGKKVLLAGGALTLTLILTRVLLKRSHEKEQQRLLGYSPKRAKKRKKAGASYEKYNNWDSSSPYEAFEVTDVAHEIVPVQPVAETGPFQRESAASKSSLTTEIMRVVVPQITAYLIILGQRKLDEYLNARKKASFTPPPPPEAEPEWVGQPAS